MTARVAIVTGATSGIGLGIAGRLVQEGFHVAMIARNHDRLRACAERFSGSASAHPADVTSRAEVEQAVASVAAIGSIVALINNAGILDYNALATPDAESDAIWDRVIAINLTGAFRMASAAAPRITAGGTIVNMSSITARTGGSRPGFLAYAASKAGLEGLTVALARDLAACDITVNAVAPGFIAETGQTGSWQGDRTSPILDSIALKRPGNVDDIAGTVVWLLSKDSRYVTGTVVPVNGGWRFG